MAIEQLPPHEPAELSQLQTDVPVAFEQARRGTPISRSTLGRLGSEALGGLSSDYGPARRRSDATQYESPELRRQRL